MHFSPPAATAIIIAITTTILPGMAYGAASQPSPKRGLVYVPDDRWPEDDQIWTQPGSDLTWYYNYQYEPSPAFSGSSQDDFEFVPMLWGPPDNTSSSSTTNSDSDAPFRQSIESLMDAGREIKHVLAFNEPDGSTQYGGSSVDPATAARVWVANVEPLALRGVKLGLPACTGGESGIPWLQQFLANCSDLVSSGDEKKNCTYDFVNIHWYGNFEGLASHLGSYSAAFPNVTQWVTEYGFADQDLATTQAFFNTSAEYFDRLDSVGRYSYFGAFRSAASNVGPDAAMLSNDGRLTDVGAWYLGEATAAAGVDPESRAGSWRGDIDGGVLVFAVSSAVLAGAAVVIW